MVKHIILWQLKDDLAPEEKARVIAGIKDSLEGLLGVIPGLWTINVRTGALPTSNADVMLDATFEDADALAVYSSHPNHVKAADTYVRPYTKNRVCMDFEM